MWTIRYLDVGDVAYEELKLSFKARPARLKQNEYPVYPELFRWFLGIEVSTRIAKSPVGSRVKDCYTRVIRSLAIKFTSQQSCPCRR